MTSLLAKRWFLLLLLVGVAGIVVVPDAMRWTLWLNPTYSGMVAIFVSAWTLQSRSLLAAVTRPWPALWAMLLSYGLLPGLGLFAGLWLNEDFRIGLILVTSVPCTLASAVIWTRMAGGDDATALLVTLLTSATSWLATTAWLVLGTGVEEVGGDTARQMMGKLLIVLVAPVLAGQLLRGISSMARFATRHQLSLGILGRLLTVAIMFKAALEVRDRLVEKSTVVTLGPLLLVAGVCLILHLLTLGVGFVSSLWLGFGRPSAIAVALSGSQKTLPVSLILFDAYFTAYPLAVVPMVFYHVGQLIVDTFIADAWAAQVIKTEDLKIV